VLLFSSQADITVVASSFMRWRFSKDHL